MDPTLVSSAWMMGLGAVGGAANAVASDDLRLWPSRINVATEKRLVRPGLGMNMLAGGAAALLLFGIVGPRGCAADLQSIGSLLHRLAPGLLIGVAVARWLTNEADKRILRQAVCLACTAPACHPDAVRVMEIAPPHVVYATAEALLPRNMV